MRGREINPIVKLGGKPPIKSFKDSRKIKTIESNIIEYKFAIKRKIHGFI